MSPLIYQAAQAYVFSPGTKSLCVQLAAWQYLTDVNTLEGK